MLNCTKKKDTLKACLSFWVPRAVGPLHPSVIQMLGGSTRKGYATSVRRQSRQRLCGEFRLRRGFACGKTLVRRIGAAGQKAGWVVLLYLFEISCGRNVRFAATSFYTHGKKEVIRPIPAPPSPTATRPAGGFYDREAIDFDRFSNSPQAFRAFGGFL